MEDGIYKDQKIRCVMCGKEFVFSAGEQRFYFSKGFKSKPKYCPECRKQKKYKGLNTITEKMEVSSSKYLNHTQLYGPSINVNGGLPNSPGYILKKEKNGDLIYETKIGDNKIQRKHGLKGKWEE